MIKIVHLTPFDGIGGVETAARSMGSFIHGGIEFRVEFIFAESLKSVFNPQFSNPKYVINAVRRYLKSDVDVLIVSLWRSAIVGLLAKLLHPRIKLVVFLHCSKDVHFVDKIVTRLAVAVADEIWADCHVTATQRIPHLRPGSIKVISFVTRRIEKAPARNVRPNFIFWGRLTRQKAIDRAIRIFGGIHKVHTHARFVIIGPDGGELTYLEELRVSLGLEDSVFFFGPATYDELSAHARSASFFLQTSEFEGMGLSVVEAMQMGIVPVVTNVGEVGEYCRDMYNSVVITSDERAIADVLSLLVSLGVYQRLSSNAVETWKDRPLYRDDVLSACKSLVAQETVLE